MFYAFGSVAVLQMFSVLTEILLKINLPQQYDSRLDHFASLLGVLVYVIYFRFTLKPKAKENLQKSSVVTSSTISGTVNNVNGTPKITNSEEPRRLKKVSTSNYIPDEIEEEQQTKTNSTKTTSTNTQKTISPQIQTAIIVNKN